MIIKLTLTSWGLEHIAHHHPDQPSTLLLYSVYLNSSLTFNLNKKLLTQAAD